MCREGLAGPVSRSGLSFRPGLKSWCEITVSGRGLDSWFEVLSKVQARGSRVRSWSEVLGCCSGLR